MLARSLGPTLLCSHCLVVLKCCSGDTASKLRLFGFPVSGDLVFGPEKDTILEYMVDRKKIIAQVRDSGGPFFQGRQVHAQGLKPKNH